MTPVTVSPPGETVAGGWAEGKTAAKKIWQGALKRTPTILFLMVLLTGGVRGQLTSLNGTLQYQQLYQDIRSGGMLATSRRWSPVLSLSAGGSIVDPHLVAFVLSSTINADWNSAHSGPLSFSSRQSQWDYYNCELTFFQYSPAKITARARENELQSESEFGSPITFSTGSRRQEQSVSVSTYKIKSLPSTTLTYERTRSWSLSQEFNPYDQTTERYSFGISSSNGNSGLSLGGSLSDLLERISGSRNRYATLQFNAVKDFTEEDRLNVDADFDRYDTYSTLTGTAAYSGKLNEQVRIFSSVYGRNSSSSTVSSLYYGLSEGLQFVQDEHWRYNAAVGLRSGKDVRLLPEGRQKRTSVDFSTQASAQHARTLGVVGMTNSATVSYQKQQLPFEQYMLSGGISSGVQTSISGFSVRANYGLSGGMVTNGNRRYHVSNLGEFAAYGFLPERIRSETAVHYYDERYIYDRRSIAGVEPLNNQRTLVGRQDFTAPVRLVIPFTLGVGGSMTWYFEGLVGRSYGWNVTFSSSSFFLPGLTAYYRYNRAFDPYYMRETAEQIAEFRYQWRALIFGFRLREFRAVDRLRDVWFSVARPFSLM